MPGVVIMKLNVPRKNSVASAPTERRRPPRPRIHRQQDRCDQFGHSQ
jgi:hypothetical protein